LKMGARWERGIFNLSLPEQLEDVLSEAP